MFSLFDEVGGFCLSSHGIDLLRSPIKTCRERIGSGIGSRDW